MMNPYAPPGMGPAGQSGAHEAGVSGCFQQHPNMVAWKQGATLPDRCAVCNAPAHGFKLQKTFYWHEPWVYVTVFVGLLVYALVALAVRKQATIAFGLCPKHKQRRVIGLAIAWGGFLLGMVLLFVAAGNASPEAAIAAVVLMIVGPIVGLVMARTIQPKRIDQYYAHMRVGDAFLASLPHSDPGPPGAWGGHPMQGYPMQGGHGYPGQPGYGHFGHGPPPGGYGGGYGPR